MFESMVKLSTLREMLHKYYVVVLIVIITVSASITIALDGDTTYKNWRENHAGKMEEAASSVSRQIEIYLHELNISAQLFADAYSETFWQLNLEPGNESLFNELSDKLRVYLPNYNSMTVTDSQGKLLYDDFGEKVGKICRDDIDAYRENLDVYKSYIHPGPTYYHFDVMVPWRYQGLRRGVFFISIMPEKISQIIRNSERDGYHLLLVRDDLTELIEVNNAGSRDLMDGKHHLTQQDQLESIEGAEISNARWIAKAVPDQNFISNKRDGILNNRLQLVFILLGFGSILAYTVFKMELRRSQVEKAEHKAMKAAQAANLAKSQFLSNMSHELRTPLNAILGFGQLINGSEKLSTDTIQEYSNEIINAGEHLLALINDVLNLSRIEAGQIVVRQESIMITEIAADCIRQIDAGLADQLNVAITDQTEDRGLVVIADYLRLKQALFNLLSNAVKYNYEGGNVFFRASLASDESLCIEISDNGMGIAEEHLDRLFEPFERLDFDNSDIEGTGIGLSVTKQLVEAMGCNGHFQATSAC
jgi:signal transduction histidine kinase